MINLLPPEEKQNLIEIRQFKIFLISGLVVLVFFVCLILFLFYINALTSSQIVAQKIILENKEKSLAAADIFDLEKNVQKANQNLASLDNFYQQSTEFTIFLEKLVGLIGQGIYLNNLSINPVEDKENIFQIYLSGHASSVEDVVNLSKNLKNDAAISQVIFPKDTWLEKENFVFSVTFESIIKK